MTLKRELQKACLSLEKLACGRAHKMSAKVGGTRCDKALIDQQVREPPPPRGGLEANA